MLLISNIKFNILKLEKKLIWINSIIIQCRFYFKFVFLFLFLYIHY